jgi:hypothetical protein
LTTEERNHHNWLLSIGSDRLGRLIDSITTGKSRLITLLELNLVYLTIVISIYPLIWDESDFKVYLWIPILLSIASLIISINGYHRKTEIIDIISYKDADFKRYNKSSEQELYDELLKNLKEGLQGGEKLCESISNFLKAALFGFGLSIVLYIIMTSLIILKIGGTT